MENSVELGQKSGELDIFSYFSVRFIACKQLRRKTINTSSKVVKNCKKYLLKIAEILS